MSWPPTWKHAICELPSRPRYSRPSRSPSKRSLSSRSLTGMDQWVTPSILSMSSPPYGKGAQPTRLDAVSKRRSRGEIVFDDLAPGGAPHALVTQNVGERGIERSDPVRNADDEGVQADRHDAARLCPLAVERVELP